MIYIDSRDMSFKKSQIMNRNQIGCQSVLTIVLECKYPCNTLAERVLDLGHDGKCKRLYVKTTNFVSLFEGKESSHKTTSPTSRRCASC